MLKWILPKIRFRGNSTQQSGATLTRMHSLETATSLPLAGRMQAARAMLRLNSTFRTFFAAAAKRFFVASSDFFEPAVSQHISERPFPTGWRAKPPFAALARATTGPSLDCRPDQAAATAASLLLASLRLECPLLCSKPVIPAKSGGNGRYGPGSGR